MVTFFYEIAFKEKTKLLKTKKTSRQFLIMQRLNEKEILLRMNGIIICRRRRAF